MLAVYIYLLLYLNTISHYFDTTNGLPGVKMMDDAVVPERH
jgi:hypothetical protein